MSSPPSSLEVERVMPGGGRRGMSDLELICLLSAIMSLTALGIDMMLPAFAEMRAEFGLPAESNELARTVTFYFLGLAVAPLAYGAIADRYGRRRVIWIAGSVYLIGALGCALAPGLNILLAARFASGVGAAGTRVVAFAVIRDLYEGDAMARKMSIMMGIFVIVPIVAPTIGAGIVAVAPWRAVFWVMAILATAILLWSSRLPETLDPANQRPASLRAIRGVGVQMASTRSIALPVVGVTAISAVSTSYLGSSELIIGDIFGRREQFALVFGGIAFVLGLASFANGWLIARFGMRRTVQGATGAYALLAAATLVGAVAASGVPAFWLFIPSLGATLALQMILRPSLNTMALAPMKLSAGTGSAILASVSAAVGSLIGASIDRQIDGTVTPLAGLLFASGLCLVFVVSAMGQVQE